MERQDALEEAIRLLHDARQPLNVMSLSCANIRARNASGAIANGSGKLTGATGQYLAFRGDGRGRLEHQEGHERLFLSFPSPFWPVVGGNVAGRRKLRSLSARRWRRSARSLRVAK